MRYSGWLPNMVFVLFARVDISQHTPNFDNEANEEVVEGVHLTHVPRYQN
jgi:hypothetical protein